MAKNNETTTTFKADISELKSAFQEAQRAVRVANSEFKSATAGMDDWSKSADGLSAKITSLNKVLDGEKKKLESLEEQYALVAKEQGENSKGAEELLIKINNQKAVIGKTEKELSNYEKALNDINKESADAEKSLEKVSKELKETGDEADKSGGKLKGFLGSLGKGVLGGIGAAVTGLAGGLMAASESSKEFTNNMSKLNSAAESAGYSTEFAKDSFENMYGVLGDETAANTTVSNFMAMETSQENLNSLLNSSAGIWAKYGDSIPLDGLAESVNETAKVGQITGNLADALNWAGISEDKFNESLAACSSEQERQQLIVDTLNSEYGKLGEQYKENNSAVIDLNTAQLEMKNSIAEIGTAFTPVLAMFTQFGAGLLSSIVPDVQSLGAAFADMVNGVDGAEEKIGGAVSNILTTLVTSITDMLPKVAEIGVQIITALITSFTEGNTIGLIFKAVTDIISTLADGIVQIAPQLLGLIVKIVYQLIDKLITLAPDLLNSAIELFHGLIDALMELDLVTLIQELMTSLIDTLITAVPQLLDGAITLFTSLLDGLTEIVPQLLAALPYIIEDITKFLTGAIPQLVEAAITLFMALVEALPTVIQSLVSALPDIIKALIDFFVQSFPILLTSGINLLMALIKAIPTICKELLKSIPQIIKAIFEGLKDLPSKLHEFFVNIWENLKEIFEPVADFFKEQFGKAVDRVKTAFSVVGDFFKNVWSDIKNAFSNVGGWFKDKFQTAVDNVKNVFSKIGDFFGDLWNTIKSKVTNLATNIGDTIGNTIKAGINGVISFVESTLNKIPEVVNGAIKMINDIPGVDIGWRMGNFNLPRLAKGGIVDEPTIAEIGENGKEAVIPLEKNLKWISLLANKLATELKTVNNTTSNSLNNSSITNNYYQTINSPKALSRIDIYRQSKNLLSFKGV